ncbi:vezatin [Lethenteron reissneri]|uniref:vezatin n=1 Tax=Lethenteron reissneri TaxID=7753 RepID=UPI002AB6BC2F|nr:vezatin [Lethenteron reissneri]
MEGADFDEDVVFKGSPLYQHLEDAGFTQLDSAERQRDPGGRPEEHAETQMESRVSCSCAEWIRRPFNLLLSHVRGLGAYAASSDQADAWRRREVATVVTRGRLLEEDVELLGLFAPEVLTWAAEPLAPTSATPRGDLAARGTAGDQLDGTSVDARKPSAWLAVAAALLAVVAVWATSPTAGGATAVPVVWWSAAAVVAAAGALVALATTARALWRRLDGARLERRCVSTGAFAGDCAALTALAKKSLRLVQESEVITRGFTLVSASCSVRTLDLGASAQLPMLRRSLYWALRSSTLALRDATRGLVASCPLDAEADNVTNYLCAVPLAELGLGMELHCGATVGVGAELRDETAILDRAAELTDGFSLQALKVLYQLWVGQSSEFLRRLVLALYAAPRGHEQGPRNRPSTPEHAFVSAASPRVSDSLRRLDRSFELHRVGCGGRAAEGGERPRSAAELATGGPGDPRGSGGGPRSELWRLHAAVRSLQLHLKMALQDSLSLEDELERLLEPGLDASTAAANGSSGGVGDSEAETAAAVEAAAELLSLLGPRMEAARACWDETVTRSRALRRRGDRDGAAADVPGRAEPTRSVDEDRPALVIIDDRDPIPEEQEFESFAGDPEDGPPPPGSDDPRGERRSPDPEERERLRRRLEEARREREEARRMLDELKSVLGVRTSLEQRAVLRSALFPAAAPRETSLQARPSSSAETPTETAARSPAVDDHSRDDDGDDGGGDGGDGESRNGVTSSRDDLGGNCEDDGGARAIGVWDAAAASAASGDEATSSAAGASEANIYSTGGCDDDDEAERESTPSSSETKREFAAGSDVDDAKTEAGGSGGGDDGDDDDANGNTSASRDYDNDADESNGDRAAGVEGEGGETAGSDGDDAGGRGAPHGPPPASLRERLAAAQLSGWHGATRDPRSVHLTSMVATQAATLSRGLLSLQEQTFGDDGDDDDDDDDDDDADDDRESQE